MNEERTITLPYEIVREVAGALNWVRNTRLPGPKYHNTYAVIADFERAINAALAEKERHEPR